MWSKTGNTNKFPTVTDTDVVSKPKWGYKASRMYMTSTTACDTTVCQISFMEDETGSCNN